MIEGAGFDGADRRSNRQLASERDATEIAQVISLITSTTSHEPRSWMEWPAISVVLLRERRVVAEFGLLADCRWVRTESGDYELADPEALRAWLRRHDVEIG